MRKKPAKFNIKSKQMTYTNIRDKRDNTQCFGYNINEEAGYWLSIFISILFHGNIYDKLLLLFRIQCQLSPCVTYNFDADRNKKEKNEERHGNERISEAPPMKNKNGKTCKYMHVQSDTDSDGLIITIQNNKKNQQRQRTIYIKIQYQHRINKQNKTTATVTAIPNIEYLNIIHIIIE